MITAIALAGFTASAAVFLQYASAQGMTGFIFPIILSAALLAGTVFTGLDCRLTGNSLRKAAEKYSAPLLLFLMLIAAPLLQKMNLPDPHNFPLRKLELAAAAPFALYMISALGVLIYSSLKSDRAMGSEKSALTVIFSGFLVFYLFMSVWFNHANKPVGDEPSYLMMAQSVISDRDLDLANNYEQRQHMKFLEREITPHELSVNGKMVSMHPVLISAFIVPFFAAAGRPGAVAGVNILAALLVALIFLVSNRAIKDVKASFIAAAVTGVSMPMLMYFNQICSDTLSGLLAAAALLAVISRPGMHRLAIMSCVLLPWAHVRNFALLPVFAALYMYENRKEMRRVMLFLAAITASLVTFFLFNMSLFGTIIPRQTLENLPVTAVFGKDLSGMLGIFLDQEFGLFFYTPVFMLFPAGMYLLWKKDRAAFTQVAGLFLPYYLMVTLWSDWHAGGGSSPRFFVPVIFFFTAALAALLRNTNSVLNRVLLEVLSVAGICISAIISIVPWFRWNKGAGDTWILKTASQFTGFDVTAMFPVFWDKPSAIWQVNLFWLAVAAGLNIIFIAEMRKSRGMSG